MSKDKNKFHDRQMALLVDIGRSPLWGRGVNCEGGIPYSKELKALEKKGLVTVKKVRTYSVFGPHIRRVFAKTTLGKTR